MKVRLLLDSGSQRSYVTNHLQESLGLPTLKQQRMLIKIFRSQQEERLCNVVNIRLRTVGGGRLELSFLSVTMICYSLSHQPISLCKAHLAPLNFANLDDGYTEMPVDMLIGCDRYCTIVTGEVVRAETGPIVIGT